MFLEMQFLIPFLIVFALAVLLILVTRPKRPPPIPRFDVTRDRARIVPDYGANYPGRGDRPKPFPRSKFRQRIADPVILTPRMLERANLRRRMAGLSPMTRDGFRSAVATSPVQYRSSDDWLSYFILYQCLVASHTSNHAYVNQGITVQPDEPGGGHGEFGGAGASGSWQDKSPGDSGVGSLAVAAGALGVLAAPDEPGPGTQRAAQLHDYGEDSKYQPGDTVGGYGGAAPERSDPAPAAAPSAPAVDTGGSSGGGDSSGGSSGGGE